MSGVEGPAANSDDGFSFVDDFETRCALKKLRNGVDGVKTFTGDVIGEMKKATWPSRQELLESTMVVIVSLIMMSLFVGFCDRVLVMILQVLIPTGCI
jgi:preprotein translocase subunit SecE